jgi:hypothetical protein
MSIYKVEVILEAIDYDTALCVLETIGETFPDNVIKYKIINDE